MSRYEDRLAADKAEIRRRLVAVGERVDRAVGNAVAALLAHDHDRASRVILEDFPVNRETRAIDKLAHAFVVRHIPSAAHLRFVSTVLRMTVQLERIGDYAVTIAREAVQLTAPPPPRIAEDIEVLSTEARATLAHSIQSFADRDADLALDVKPLQRAFHRSYDQVFEDLVGAEDSRPISDLFALLLVFQRLDRVNDQAKNISEETIFEVQGKTKPPKRFRVLFYEATDDLYGPMAAALAKKAFPDSGRYESVGTTPRSALDPDLIALASKLGLDLEGSKPRALPALGRELARYDIVVSIGAELRMSLGKLPYQTVFLDWPTPIGERVEERAAALAEQIAALMTTLRGEDAP